MDVSSKASGSNDTVQPSDVEDADSPSDTTTPVRSNLNPFAKEWNPMFERAPENDRCLYITFSNGYPLTEHQLVNFFTTNFGPCVERVYVHRARPGPLFGKVIFNRALVPATILRGEKEAKFIVDGKPLWCKKFEPRETRSRND